MSARPPANFEPEEQFMRLAIAEAQAAKNAGDYAIGAAVVRDGALLACSGNRIKIEYDPTQHAEIATIRLACASLRTRHLEGAVLYSTAEPCPMCTSAAIWARMSGIISGSTLEDMAEFREKFGNPDWSWRTVDIASRAVIEQGTPTLFLIEGFLREECRCLFHDS